MAPIKAGKYVFSPESLVEVRTRFDIRQTEMAKLLGIPANTLSRWETGATTPDAESLAAIYSTAVERGITPNFFKRRPPVVKPMQGRSRLLVMLDFQNLGVQHQLVAPFNDQIRTELDKRFAATSYRRYKAFAHPSQAKSTEKLQKLGWRVWEDDVNIDQEIISQCKSDCGQEPKDTALVLVTKDGDFADLIQELKAKGVDVWLVTPETGFSQRLVQIAGTNHWIKLASPQPNKVGVEAARRK